MIKEGLFDSHINFHGIMPEIIDLITSITHYHDNQFGNPIKDDCRFEFIWMG